MNDNNKQIFYSDSPRRWVYSKRMIFSVIIFLAAIFSVTLGGIILGPSLPQLDLASPDPIYRGAPKNASSTTPPAAPTVSQGLILSSNGATASFRPKVLGFYVNWDDNSFSSLKENIQNMDELVPEWLHLGDVATPVLVDDQTAQDNTINYIKQVRPNLPVVPLINNYNSDTQDWDSNRLSVALATSDSRSALIDAILNFVRQNNFSGISIDFENVAASDQANLVLFMQELYAKFHPLNLEVSQNIPLNDDSFNAKELSKYNDFLILMAYDEHTIYDSTAGPIASQNWMIDSLNIRLKEAPMGKYVIALGGYGYDWIDNETAGQEVTFQQAMSIAKKSGATVNFDPASSNPTFDYTDENNRLHHIWFLDAATVFNEMAIGRKMGGPYGYALWRLGSEDPSSWQAFSHREDLTQAGADSLQLLKYGYDISYLGQGEILKVTGTPQEGARTVSFDAQSGFIKDENISKFPSPYVITRWGGGENNKNKIVLTFDDGPDQKYTSQILNILKKYNVPAVFFLIGANANVNPNIVRQEFKDGNEIGSHTYSHPNITQISDQQLSFELGSTQRLIEGILGRKTVLFRPPYAEDIEPATPDQARPLVSTDKEGYYTVAMHIDPNDWSSPGVDNIVNRVIDGAKNGDGNVVLLHDGGGNRSQTVAALPKIIEGLRSQGFEFVSVSELIGTSRDNLMPTVSTKEKLLVFSGAAMVFVVDHFNRFMHFMFFLGIILGTMRFLFIGTLAIIQWAHARHGLFRKFEKSYRPTVGVIIPAYNEEKVVARTVQAILASDYPDLDVVVVDDGSSDRTYQVLIENFSQDPRVKIITKENGGKSEALNLGILKTEAEIIVTLDADTVFLSNTISKLVRKFVDRRVWAVAGNAKVGNRINLLTRWQALEYITSQNLDRRAFEVMNCITVVPGAVGAWRRVAIIEAGGFSKDTLAEDADLTFAIIRRGHNVAYEDEALAYTEAPDATKNFVKQRFRWMYGTLQTVWKHRDVWGRKKYGALGFFSVPNVLIFQIIFPLISPLMDLTMLLSIFWAVWQNHYHPIDYSSLHAFRKIFIYYLFFLIIDLLTAAIPFFLEHKENWTLIIWLPLQRFYYRQLMYYVAIKAVLMVLRGSLVGWGKFERKATVKEAV
ncbi:MAG: glycosyltransferase [Parcubacteria group bacterium]